MEHTCAKLYHVKMRNTDFVEKGLIQKMVCLQFEVAIYSGTVGARTSVDKIIIFLLDKNNLAKMIIDIAKAKSVQPKISISNDMC